MFKFYNFINYYFLFAVTRGLEPPPHGLTVRHCNLFKPRHQILLAVHKGFEPLSRDRQSRISYLSTNGPNICHLSDPLLCTGNGTRTHTLLPGQQILSLSWLPITTSQHQIHINSPDGFGICFLKASRHLHIYYLLYIR